MNYPGNPSMSQDVQVKTTATFEQAIQLVAQGKDQEALAGCEFILGLDPLFQPARKLQERLNRPERPVMVDDLRLAPAAPLTVDTAAIEVTASPAMAPPAIAPPAIAPPAIAPPAIAPPAIAPPAPALAMAPPAPSQPIAPPAPVLAMAPPAPSQAIAPPAPSQAIAPPAPSQAIAPPTPVAAPTTGLGVVLNDLLAKGNYQQVLQIASSQAQAIENDPSLQAMVEKARASLATAAVPENDLLDLQRMSLSLETDADPLSQISEGPLLDDLDLDSDDSGLLDLEGGLDDLDALDLDELALPDLDAVPSIEAVPELTPEIAPESDPLLSLDNESLSLDNESLSLDNESLSLDNEPLSLDNEPLSLDSEPLSLDSEPLSLDSEPLSLDSEPLSLDSEPLSLDTDSLSLPDVATPLTVESEPIGPIPGMPMADELTLGDDDSLSDDDLSFGDDDEEEGQEKIEELLQEGQDIFATGYYQGAIDIWSRIFLIDISNGPASQRIEEARKKKAELERQAEEIFHEGVEHIESESLEEAKDAFRRVLEVDPNHSLADDYLKQLEAGQVPTVKPRASEASELDDLTHTDMGPASEASPSLEAAVQRDRVVVVKKTDKRMIALAALVALLVVGGGGWLFFNKDKIFPNAQQGPQGQPPRIDPIVRATRIYESGDMDTALVQLRGIPVDDPAYEQALGLIAQWEASVTEEEVDTGPPPELLRRRNLLLAAARTTHAERRFLRAQSYFERAHKILALESGDLALKLNCDAELLSLEPQIEKFRSREYAEILPGLWRRREGEPDNKDITRLMVDAYYNLALINLQRGETEEAALKLKDAREVDPDDEDLHRLHLFATTYSTKFPDLIFRIFVKHLPGREL